MKTFALAVLLAARAGGPSFAAVAASVEASTLTTVAVEAPLHDKNLSDANGCDPSGCIAALTRDGDATNPNSRWSCKPSLGAAGSTCSIIYVLAESLTLEALKIALYKGDSRTRTMDIMVDDEKILTWTSSGTTTAFETVDLGVTGQKIELRGVLGANDWISITEVEIVANDGGSPGTAVVEAGDLGVVTATAPVYDTRLTVADGCDPKGCTAALTRDNNLTATSRWSCAPKLGGSCTISYDLGSARELSELRIALYKGASRARTVDVHVDGVLITTWTSSGTTNGFENIDLTGTVGQVIDVTGVLANSEWISIIETEIMVLSESPPPSTGIEHEAGDLGTVTATATFYDTRLSTSGGCDPKGCTADLTRDGDLSEASRWSCAPKLGGTCSIFYDLGGVRDLSQLRLAMYKGTTRVRTVDIHVDGALVTTWTSSGATNGFESVDLTGTSGRVVNITGILADSEWLSIVETKIMVHSDGGVTLPPAPSPPPVVTPTGDLQTVGLLPMSGSFETKDGDLSTFWSCAGDPPDGDQKYYDCDASFDMFSYRHIKQVKIALANGASGPTKMSISMSSLIAETQQVFVTSSGTTNGFETYDFDFFTKDVVISPIFTSAGQSINIAEVEFVEEVQPGQITVTEFGHPYDNGDGLWTIPDTDAFAWSSESDQAVDKLLFFTLSSYATVDAIELQFPVGDTYKFDLGVYEDGIVNYGEEPRQTFTGLESTDTSGWQSFDLTGFAGDYVTSISIVIKGTGSGAPGFKLLDARIMGTPIDNPTDTYYVASTRISNWDSKRYPDFVTAGTGDQRAIMSAICAVKKTSFDGVDCIGGDDAATGTVIMPMGEWFVDGNIFMKSGVFLNARFSIDDSPYTTEIFLEEGARGKTDVDAIVVMDGISDAQVDDLWIRGNYIPESSNDSPAVSGLGSVGLSIVGSKNITCLDTWIENIDGDGLVVRDSQSVNIDAGPFDEEYLPWSYSMNRGTGMIVDSSDSVWVRRCAMYDNGVAGIHIVGSNNFTFEATRDPDCHGESWCVEGEGEVGSLDGQQPIEVIVENSTLIKFQDMKVLSINDPIMTVTDSSVVSFDDCGFLSVPPGTCVIQADELSVIDTTGDPELNLVGSCYVKV